MPEPAACVRGRTVGSQAIDGLRLSGHATFKCRFGSYVFFNPSNSFLASPVNGDSGYSSTRRVNVC